MNDKSFIAGNKHVSRSRSSAVRGGAFRFSRRRDRMTGILLFLPLVALMVILSFYPVFRVFTLSLQEQGLFSQTSRFVGISNFIRIFQHEGFWRAFNNTLVFSFGGLALQTLLGLGIAMLLHARFPLRNSVRGSLLFSYLVPYVVAALTWRFMLSDATGVLNYAIRQMNLPMPASWFGSPQWAMPGVIFVNTWKNFPFMVLVFLATLQSISPELYQASAVDGATRWQAFRYITFPALVPALLIVGMLRTIWNYNNFEVVFLLTQGGPLGRTETFPLLIHRFVFGEFSMGRGAALAIVVLAILFAMSFVYWKLYETAQERLS